MYSDQMRKTHTPYSVFDVYELLQTGAAKYTARARIARAFISSGKSALPSIAFSGAVIIGPNLTSGGY